MSNYHEALVNHADLVGPADSREVNQAVADALAIPPFTSISGQDELVSVLGPFAFDLWDNDYLDYVERGEQRYELSRYAWAVRVRATDADARPGEHVMGFEMIGRLAARGFDGVLVSETDGLLATTADVAVQP